MPIHGLLFRDLMHRLGWRMPVLVALMSLVGLGEGASVVLLLPLLNHAGIASTGNKGLANELLDKGLSLIGATSSVEILAVIIAVATIQMVLFVGLNWWTTRLARRYQGQRQAELFRAFIGAKWHFFADKKAGELTNAIVTECTRLGTAFGTALSILSTAVVVVIYFGFSLLIAWQVMLCLIVFALLSALGMARIYRISYRVGQSLTRLNAELQSTLVEQFAAIKIIKATASERRATARVDPLVRTLERANALLTFLPLMVRGLLEFLALVGLSIVIVLASNGMGVSVGNVVVVLALFSRLFPRLTTLQASMHYLNGYVHAIGELNQLQSAAEAEAEPQDHSNHSLRPTLPTALTVQKLDVTFGQSKILDQVTVTVPIPGMLAVVGGSGAGKSTLAHTLLGLVKPSAGSVRLGPHELHALPLGAWRRVMGYVPQETILFHASVRENITLANPDASDAEVKAAVRRARAEEFIDALPEGFDTTIGDQGVKLSGGQRQRLSIARALLTNPVVLLMDEATSALDTETEAELLATLQDLRKQMGILIIAHRLAAVQSADSICVMEAGRVVECGTWAELMASRTRLRALTEAQVLTDQRSIAI